MTYRELNVFVESLGLPTAYYQFTDDTATAPPFVCWFFTDSQDFYADNTNYQLIRPVRLELYTDFKDFGLEIQIETALSAAGLTYDRSEGAIEAERMYMVTYDFSVTITLEGENENA